MVKMWIDEFVEDTIGLFEAFTFLGRRTYEDERTGHEHNFTEPHPGLSAYPAPELEQVEDEIGRLTDCLSQVDQALLNARAQERDESEPANRNEIQNEIRRLEEESQKNDWRRRDLIEERDRIAPSWAAYQRWRDTLSRLLEAFHSETLIALTADRSDRFRSIWGRMDLIDLFLQSSLIRFRRDQDNPEYCALRINRRAFFIWLYKDDPDENLEPQDRGFEAAARWLQLLSFRTPNAHPTNPSGAHKWKAGEIKEHLQNQFGISAAQANTLWLGLAPNSWRRSEGTQ